MIYLVGGTQEVARWYARHELNMNPRGERGKLEVMSVAAVKQGRLTGVHLKKDDEIIKYCWELGTLADCRAASEEIHILEVLREQG